MQHLKLSATAVAATIMAIASSAHAQAVPAPGTPLPAAPGAAAQPAAAAPALPNQQGVVYPGRTYQPSAVVVQQQPVTAMPGIPGPRHASLEKRLGARQMPWRRSIPIELQQKLGPLGQMPRLIAPRAKNIGLVVQVVFPID